MMFLNERATLRYLKLESFIETKPSPRLSFGKKLRDGPGEM
jgi:hypothetical protein